MSANKTNISQIRKYLNGQLDARAMHQLELEAQDDPFLMDALEGYEAAGKDQQTNLNELQQRLDERVAPKARRSIIIWRVLPIAASLLIAISIGYWLFRADNAPEKQPTALTKAIVLPPKDSDANKNGVVRSKLSKVDRVESCVIRQEEHLEVESELPPGVTNPTHKPDTGNYKAYGYAAKPNVNDLLKKTKGIGVVTFGNIPHQGQLNITKDSVKSGLIASNMVQGRLPGVDAIAELKEVQIRGAFPVSKRKSEALASISTTSIDTSFFMRKAGKAKPTSDSVTSLAEVVVSGYPDKKPGEKALPLDGWKGYLAYIAQQAVMPNGAIGKVKLAFLVGTDGKISGIRIIRGRNTDMNDKAIAIIQNGPGWTGANKQKEIKLKIKFHKKPDAL